MASATPEVRGRMGGQIAVVEPEQVDRGQLGEVAFQRLMDAARLGDDGAPTR
jgi:hypothetical protein